RSRRAWFARQATVLGWRLPSTRSNTASARRYSAAASTCFPCALLSTARLFKVMAISGWSGCRALPSTRGAIAHQRLVVLQIDPWCDPLLQLDDLELGLRLLLADFRGLRLLLRCFARFHEETSFLGKGTGWGRHRLGTAPPPAPSHHDSAKVLRFVLCALAS